MLHHLVQWPYLVPRLRTLSVEHFWNMGRRGCRITHVAITEMDGDLATLSVVRPCFTTLFAECAHFALNCATGDWVDVGHVELETRALLGSAGLAPAFAPG